MMLIGLSDSFNTKLWDHVHHQVQSVTKKENVFVCKVVHNSV